MTEHLSAVETLAALIHDLTYRGKQVPTGTSRAIADSILRSDWLAEQKAKAWDECFARYFGGSDPENSYRTQGGAL